MNANINTTLLQFSNVPEGGLDPRIAAYIIDAGLDGVLESTKLKYESASWTCDTQAILTYRELGYYVCKITWYSSPRNSSSGHTVLEFSKLEYQVSFFNAQNLAHPVPHWQTH